MACDYPQKLLETFAAVLNHIIAEAVGEDFAGERWNRDASGFALEHITKVLEIRVAAADGGLLELEGRDIGDNVNLVVGVHMAAGTVGSWIAHLNLQQILWWPIDLLVALLSSFWESHICEMRIFGLRDAAGVFRRWWVHLVVSLNSR